MAGVPKGLIANAVALNAALPYLCMRTPQSHCNPWHNALVAQRVLQSLFVQLLPHSTARENDGLKAASCIQQKWLQGWAT